MRISLLMQEIVQMSASVRFIYCGWIPAASVGFEGDRLRAMKVISVSVKSPQLTLKSPHLTGPQPILSFMELSSESGAHSKSDELILLPNA
ncbi:hypothetical protein Y032_0053g2317 [Ancylostoma ceylanicum]|uniref:Uncharacterized protein n=1 Tax=Ancylostoma ceylanicum TaxID=53326 RepID=A0A016U887_9BILA|nr:hypothetical protein Y032_0053g2317 [Ancylostoma ceylanicum]